MSHDNESDENEPFVEEFAEEGEFGDGDDLFEEAPYTDEEFSEEEYLTEEWEDDEFGDYDEEDPEASGSKKKLPSNAVIIGGGAVFALVVLFMMGGGGSSEAPQPAPGATAPTQQAPGPAPTQMDYIYGNKDRANKVEEVPDLTKGLMHDDEAVKEIENIKDEFVFEGYVGDDEEVMADPGFEMPTEVENPPMPAPMAQTGAAVPRSPDEPLTPMPEGANTSSGNSSEMGSYQDAKSPSLAEKENAEFDSPASQRWQNETAGSDTGAADPALMNKINNIAESLSRMDQRLSEIEMTVDSIREANIEAHLSRLENKIRTIEKGAGRTVVSSTRSSAPKEFAPTTEAPKQALVSVPLPARAPQRPEGAERGSQVLDISWVLKGARPGEAVISKKGSEEIKVVHEGDQLSGLGTIQTIRQEGGRWVVKGSKAYISQ